ncbi:MAG: hypothetical protein JWL95_264 [Gemmatimonadetes bacterium]|nr:hypothetical protein [Gemmatimonadota bacterium]
MDFPLKEAIGAAVTLTVAGLGYRQWLRGRRSGQYIADRERSYKEIWDALESANLYVREGAYTADAFRERVRATNTLVLRHGLHFEEADRPAVQRYLMAIEETGRILTSGHTDDAFKELQSSMRLTLDSAVDLKDFVPTYSAAISELDESRRAVVRAFQDKVGRPYV